MKNCCISIIFSFLSVILFTNNTFSQNKDIIEKLNLKLDSDLLTPEVLWSMGRVSDIRLSPDKKTLLFGITYYSVKENKGNRELYTIDVKSSGRKSKKVDW